MKPYIVCVLLISLLFGCTTYTEPADTSKFIHSENGRVITGNLSYKISNITYSEDKNFSYLIGITAMVINNYKTSVHASSEAYLIDKDGNQFDVDWEATYEIQKKLSEAGNDIPYEGGAYGYELQPKLPIVVIWGFKVPKSSTSFYFYHKPLPDEPAIIH